jgi:hypothetical protein
MAKFWLSVAVIFVLSMAIGFLVHGTLLMPAYQDLSNLFRTPEEQGQMFAYMLVGHVFLAFAFVAIYLRGQESKPFLGQGARYGVLIALLVAFPMYMIYYAVQPIPAALAAQQIIFDSIGFVVMGVVVAWLNR